MPKKLYEVLGIQNENVSAEEIRKAYRRQALKYHPDKNKAADAEEKFKAIGAAYAILNDEEQRKQYDKGLINDKGESTQPEFKPSPQRGSEAFTPNPKRNFDEAFGQDIPRRTTPRPMPRAQSSNSNRDSFFKTNPAQYYFFNSAEYAQNFTQPKANRKQGPVFVYVTPTPLEVLFAAINAQNAQSSKNKHYKAQNKAHLHRDSSQNIPYVFVQSNYAPQMERIIDRLIMLKIILEQLEKTAELKSDRRDDIRPRFM